MLRRIIIAVLLATRFCPAEGDAAVESFDRDPKWDGYRNRLVPKAPPTTRQKFGYSTTRHAGGKAKGEIGGWVQRSTTPAWYARKIKPVGLDSDLSASGKFVIIHNEGGSGALFGWFNANSRGWRMPNSLVLRLDGNGDKYWLLFEYGTRNWLTGGGATFEGRYQTTKTKPFLDGTVHTWRLTYRPSATGGDAELELMLDGVSYREKVPAAHVADGATFDRFGIVNQQLTGDGMELYFDDLEVNGERFEFDSGPGWEGQGHQVEFPDRVRRPFHDFGFTGEANIGGIIWRDEMPAWYARSIEPVNLHQRFLASGSIVFRSAGSDSAVYIGFFDAAAKRSQTSPEHSAPPTNMVAILIEGFSRIGHYFRAGYRNQSGQGMFEPSGPTIRPDGQIHQWALEYVPNSPHQDGEILLAFDGQIQRTGVRKEHKSDAARFDRFGICNVQVGGHYVEIYLDDLRVNVPER